MTVDLKQQLVRAVVEQMAKRPQPTMGAPSGLTCECGGVFHDAIVTPPKLYNGPPRSNNRRIRKKQLKRWLEKTRPFRMMSIMIGAMRPRGWICASCYRRMGFYEGVGRNVFKVEPLPPGALLTYDRDPDVASLVVGVSPSREEG